MKLVAAARLRRAQESVIAARPYSESLTRVADSVLTGEGALLGPAEDAKNVALIVVISSDRGLCGSYNANLLKLAQEVGRGLEDEGREPRFFVVGRKARDHFKRIGASMAGERVNNPRLASVELARDIASETLAAYRSAEIREARLVYMHFRSAMSLFPTCELILPLSQRGKEAAEASAGAEAEADTTPYLVEPSREQLVPVVMRTYVESAVFHALLEAEASEHGARMTAMDNATSNASEMIGRLTLEMNRARQAQITRELMDIVGGAEALRG